MQNFIRFSLIIFIFLTAAQTGAAQPAAQTTAFNYQGKLTDGGSAASGSYQMQFKLFDALAGGTQIGATLSDVPVTASQGVFAVKLDFGANAFGGANRFLEIAVRRNAGESYVTLTPREQIASSPYAVRTISAAMADDSQKLGGVAASEYVTNSTVGSSFIRNGTTLQTANFNISGNGYFGGNVGIGTTTPETTLDVNGAIRSIRNSSTDIIAQTTGGTNSWARLTMATPSRAWTMGTSTNFNSNQFYLSDATIDQFRFTIQPNGGAISFPFGNLGIGTTNPLTKLHVLGTGTVETSTGSTNDRAIFSLNSTIGGANRVWTLENGLFGTAGLFGIYDRTAAQARFVINTNGNVGIGTNNPVSSKFEVQDTSVGTAVFGNTTTAGSGVFGSSQNGSGYGVYGQNAAGGFAMYAEGKAGQNLAGFGLPKAMVFVLANGTISRCYNGVSGATTNGCGFSVSSFTASGIYTVDLGFNMSGRFVSAVPYGGERKSLTVFSINPTSVTLGTSFIDQTRTEGVVSDFFLIVY